MGVRFGMVSDRVVVVDVGFFFFGSSGRYWWSVVYFVGVVGGYGLWWLICECGW